MTTAAIGFGLIVIVISSLTSIFGPGLALRGPEGSNSVHRAVDHMRYESKVCFKIFVLQLLCFHLSSFLLIWMLYSPNVAFIINSILLAFLILFGLNALDIVQKFYVEEQQAVSGQFQDFSGAI